MQTLLYKLLRTLFLSFFFLIYLHASVASPIAIDINSTTNGVLTNESETSPNSYNASEYYTFTLTEDKNISISVESDIYYKIYLLDNYGSILKEASKYDYKKKKIIITLAQGTYRIDVTTVFNDSYGSFMLTLKENIIETHSITLDTILDGEWTSNSGISPGSIGYSNYYTFVLTENTDVLIDLESNSPYLYLLDSNNNVIAKTGSSGYRHAKIVQTLEAGTYTIDVTSNNYNSGIGIYTLRFKTNIIITTDIELNSTIEGTWSLSSGVSPQSKYYTNYYTFTIDEDKNIAIGMESDVSIEKLYLLDDNMSIIAESYGKRVIVKHLEAGTYTIDATLNNALVGNFSLFLKENIISNIAIDVNSSNLATWDETSGISQSSGGYSNYYTFTLTEQTNIVMSITGTNSILYLLDENGNRDYSVYFRNGSLVGILSAGTYTVEATQSIRRDESYQFEVYENKVENEPISLGESITRTLSPNDGLSKETHNYAKEFTFTLSKKTDVVINLNSGVEYSRVILKNDNGMRNYIFSRSVYSLEAGTYVLEMTYIGTDKNNTGSFTLGLKENSIEEKPILLNRVTQGNWSENSGVTFSGHYVNRYTFSLAETTNVIIQMQSQYAKSIKFNGIRQDGRYDSNDLLFSTVLNAGTYVIDVIIEEYTNIYQTGDYTLWVQADVAQPLPVNALSTQVVGAHSATITWEKGNDSTVGYKIYLNGTFVADVEASQNSYVLYGLNTEHEYEYSVIAYNSAGVSEAVKGKFTTKEDDYAWLIPIQHNILN